MYFLQILAICTIRLTLILPLRGVCLLCLSLTWNASLTFFDIVLVKAVLMSFYTYHLHHFWVYFYWVFFLIMDSIFLLLCITHQFVFNLMADLVNFTLLGVWNFFISEIFLAVFWNPGKLFERNKCQVCH